MEAQIEGNNLTVSINDFHLSYNDVGIGTTPIICLHGFPFDKTMWQRQLDYFQPYNRIIACDIRGFGKSIDEETPLSIDLFSNDLIAFMDKLNIHKAIICGLSMGGFIALNAVNRFPERIAALILCDTQCIADTTEVKEKRHQIIDEIQAKGITEFNEAFVKSVFHEESLVNKKELVDQLSGVVFANSQHIIIQGLKALAERSETCSTLNKIAVPTLIVCGREDEVTPLEQSAFMNESIIESVLQIIDNAGHVSNLEHPDEFNLLLHHFLKGLHKLDFGKINGKNRMV